jgi:hypothetical protein
VVDLGSHFQNAVFLARCAEHDVTVRNASAGSLRATAHVERFIRTLKAELPWAPGDLVPTSLAWRIEKYLTYYHAHRPHQGLGGRTLSEVLRGVLPANRRPRHEPRPRWPRGSRCTNPQAPPRDGKAGRIVLVVERDELGLPIVRLKRVAGCVSAEAAPVGGSVRSLRRRLSRSQVVGMRVFSWVVRSVWSRNLRR